ncbi:MAG: hypothetical protein QM669_04825 [Siphonobacter sp.]
MKYGWLGLLFMAQWVSAQRLISGKLRDGKQQAALFVNITLHEPNSTAILAFAQSDKEGKYRLTYNAKSDSLQVKIYGLGFATKLLTIVNQSQELNVELQEKSTELKEVVVKQPPITRQGDTLSYSVNAFKTQRDRSIGDLIKRLPGIEIDASGQIKYQGKPINKYYIEGLDLLEGRYSLANENLPVDAVTQVQVIEKHQPIRVLDSLVLSDQAAINIQLRNNIATTGTAHIGIGGSPFLWEANLTPMFFSKKQQLIASYQSNNVGNPIETQIRILTIEDALNPFSINRPPKPWVRIIPVEIPSFSESRWLYNRPQLGTLNYLKKLTGNYQLKLNISYLNDHQRQTGNTLTRNYTSTDTIQYTENIRNTAAFNTLEAGIVLEKNEKSVYFKNQTTLHVQWDQARSVLTNNTNLVDQALRNNYFILTNQFKDIVKIKKQAINIQSFLRLQRLPQTLGIGPGPFANLFNNSTPFDSLVQRVVLKGFFFNTMISFRKNVNGILVSPQLGFQFENQHLESQILRFITDDNSQWLTGDFINRLNWRKSALYSKIQFQYQLKNWKATANIPLTSYRFSIADSLLKQSQKVQQLAFEPKLNLSFEPDAFWILSAQFNRNYDFGEINDIYYGYLLKDYRSIQRRNVPLSQTKSWNGNVNISYRDQIHSIFGNLIFSKSWSDYNLMYGSILSANGVTENYARSIPNSGIIQMLMGKITKYVHSLRSQLSVSYQKTNAHLSQLLNYLTLPFETVNRSWDVNLDIKPSKIVNLYYTLKASKTRVEMNEQQPISASQYRHQLELSVYPSKKMYIGFINDYYLNNSQNNSGPNLFSDIVFRYTFSKKKIDIETKWTNIWNTKQMTVFSASSYSYISSTYQLRPMQLMQTVRFSF